MAEASPGGTDGSKRKVYDVESLLAVAVAVFNEQGYDGTSMEDLSKRLGITKSAIYHHVESKEAMLSIALDRALEGLFALVADTSGTGTAAVERLEHLVRASVNLLVERLPYVTLLLRVRGNTEVERRALDQRRTFDRVVADLVKQAQREGDIRSDVDPGLTARLVFGMVNSLVEWHHPADHPAGPDIADAVARLAFDGLRATSSQLSRPRRVPSDAPRRAAPAGRAARTPR